MKIKLDKYDIAMVNATVPVKEGRPLLQNLCIRNGKLAAVDGFMIVVREANIVEGKHEGDTLLPASIVKTIRSTPKRQAELTLDDNSASVHYKDDTDQPVEFNPSLHFQPYSDSKEFPKYDVLFPQETNKTAQIAINVGLLKRLVSCLPEDGILRMGITEPTSPLEFHCSQLDRPIYGLLMPMYVDWQDFKWLRDKPEPEKKEE